MKILFICTCLEPGKDGVGDYTKLLGEELTNLNHDIAYIALNDSYIEETSNDNRQLKLPKNNSWKNKKDIIIPFINDFKPDWISLQFVIYGFHPKGLPFQIPSFFSKIHLGYKWHIMFHELNIGLNSNTSFKHKIYGYLQWNIIKNLIKKTKPQFLSTNTELYKTLLAKVFKDDIIHAPVFSNISYQVSNIPKQQNGLKKIVLFGSIFPVEQLNSFFEEIKLLPVLLIFLGKQNLEKNRWIQNCLKYEVSYEDKGECTACQISNILSTSNFGLSTSPTLLLDKSGTIAAYLEHRLPVINLPMRWNVKGFNTTISNPNLHQYKMGNLKTIIESEFINTGIQNARSTAINLINTAGGQL